MSQRLFIIDGHAYAYRAFYAIRQLNSPSGKPTNAIYGFIKMLGKMRAFLQPSHLMVVWDGGLASERMTLLPEYKTHRPPMPAPLEMQLDEIVRYLKCANIASYLREGIEADDWIATLTRRAVEKSLPVVIASADKDFFQLVSPLVGLLNPNDKEARIWTREEVCAKTGVCPEQIVDWLSLIGDSVDNIPGVPGIGPMTAANLLKQFGSLDDLLTRLDEVKSARHRENLRAAQEAIRRNQKMIRLRDDLPDDCSLEELAMAPPNNQLLMECYSEWGFKSLLQEAQTQEGFKF
ncbi:MAG: flap endonuclease [Verrucomicrobiota bacterium]|nr:flap endonuclease [Verrucomicrobiota bacterium]